MKCLLFPEISSSGGTRSFFKDLLLLHNDKGIISQVVLPLDSTDASIKSYINGTGAQYTLVKDRTPLFRTWYFCLLYEFFFYTEHIKKFKPDLIVVSSGTPGLNFFCFFFSIPCIYISHTYPPPISWKKKVMFSIPRLFVNKKKRLFTVSEYSKSIIIKQWQVPEQFIEVIYNSSRKALQAQHLPETKKIVLTLGHLEDYKNPLLWIELAEKITAKYKDVEFIWLGEGKLLEYCQGLSSNNRRIKFPGHKEEVFEYYLSAYLYLQPSLIESLGISVLDAMSFGIPCIVSDVGGLPETIENEKSGYICSNSSANNYIEKISHLLDNPALRSTMGENAKRRANEVFNPAIQRNKIISLYQEVLTKA